MKRAPILLAVALLAAVAVLGWRWQATRGDAVAGSAPLPAAAEAGSSAAPEAGRGFLHGRVATVDGATYEGRLRIGGDQEASWDDLFHGVKRENPWAVHLPPGRRTERRPVTLFGLALAHREHPVDLGRPFVARFGDLARVEARGRDVRVVLRSGTAVDLDRFEASDFDDGVRVWDRRAGVVDLDSLRIRALELLPAASFGPAPGRLHGTVRTRQGDFSGFVRWNREDGLGSDELETHAADGARAVRFEDVRAIARQAGGGARVTLADGRELALRDSRDAGPGDRGLDVEDRRYGRVLVSWDAFERVDFLEPGAAGSGPGYGDFPPGRPLAGRVTTRTGRALAGRLVFDLDESESTDLLDAPAGGVDYTIPFGRIAAVVLAEREEAGTRGARVILHGGEELRLERAGDLGAGNAGMLVFPAGALRPEHVPWSGVERIDFEDAPP